jgi:SAM-dependent methyltransferase
MNSETSHKTSISRSKMSAPCKWLLDKGVLVGSVLDFGCGRGKDIEELRKLGVAAEGWDPNPKLDYDPSVLDYEYDTVLCTYVLNTLPEEEENKVIAAALRCVKSGGSLLVSVRRDVPKKGSGTQRYVELNDEYRLYKKSGSYQIYAING